MDKRTLVVLAGIAGITTIVLVDLIATARLNSKLIDAKKEVAKDLVKNGDVDTNKVFDKMEPLTGKHEES